MDRSEAVACRDVSVYFVIIMESNNENHPSNNTVTCVVNRRARSSTRPFWTDAPSPCLWRSLPWEQTAPSPTSQSRWSAGRRTNRWSRWAPCVSRSVSVWPHSPHAAFPCNVLGRFLHGVRVWNGNRGSKARVICIADWPAREPIPRLHRLAYLNPLLFILTRQWFSSESI